MPRWLVLNPSKCWGKTKPAAVRGTKCQRMMSLQKWALFVLSISIVFKRSPRLKMTSKCICEILHHVRFAWGRRAHSDSAQTSTGETTERADVSGSANRAAAEHDCSINNWWQQHMRAVRLNLTPLPHMMLADNSGFPHDKRGAGTFKLLSCWNHLQPELWLSGKGSRDARVIGFAQCSELSWVCFLPPLFALILFLSFFAGTHTEM